MGTSKRRAQMRAQMMRMMGVRRMGKKAKSAQGRKPKRNERMKRLERRPPVTVLSRNQTSKRKRKTPTEVLSVS